MVAGKHRVAVITRKLCATEPLIVLEYERKSNTRSIHPSHNLDDEEIALKVKRKMQRHRARLDRKMQSRKAV